MNLNNIEDMTICDLGKYVLHYSLRPTLRLLSAPLRALTSQAVVHMAHDELRNGLAILQRMACKGSHNSWEYEGGLWIVAMMRLVSV